MQHRVDEIRQLSDRELWRHCPGRLNPADLPSRGTMASALMDQVLWWQEPDFLRESTTNWPTIEVYDLNHEAQMEMVKNITPITLSLVSMSSTFVCQSIKELIDSKKYGGLNRLLRVTSYVIRFIKKCRKQTDSFDPFISRSEMNQSELLWIKSVQRSFFGS